MKDSSPTEYAVIDVETTMITDGEFPTTLFWGYADKDGYKTFKTTSKLLRFLTTSEPRILLHHSNFDVLQLLLDGAKVQILRSHNSRLIRCKIYSHILLNSYSSFPLTLQSIFECFGFVKTDLSYLTKRNYEDCVNGLDCFLRLDNIFQRLVGISPLAQGTIAGTSFKAACIMAGKLPEDQRFLEAYRGGRVEVYDTRYHISSDLDWTQIQEGLIAEKLPVYPEILRVKNDCNKFDICSSYPRSILEATNEDILYKVRVTTKDYYAPLFDSDGDDMLLFPNGSFVSWVFKSTLEKYLEPNWTNTDIKILDSHKIDTSWLVRIQALVRTLYAKKLEAKLKGEKAIETACKLLLNAMYGRIGLKGESERARILDYFPDCDEATIFPLGRKRWLVFETIFRPTKSNFPLAGFITDNARGRWYEGTTKNKSIYGDTDSLICPNRNPETFIGTQGKNCGDWSHEGEDSFKANNVKDYFWGEEEVRKGGSGFTMWTLKRLGSGKPPALISRERISELRKREVLPNGETVPHVVYK